MKFLCRVIFVGELMLLFHSVVYEISAQTYIFNFISMASCSAIVGVSRSQGSVKLCQVGEKTVIQYRYDVDTVELYFMWLCRDCHDYSCAGGQLGYVSAVGDDCLKAARLETATVQQ